MTLYHAIIVGVGGFLGSALRYLSVQWVDRKMNSIFPYGTLLVNVLGSLILGLIVGYSLRVNMPPNWRLFLSAGFCGGFTTFSAFAFENVTLLQQKMIGTSLAYTAISVGAGFLAMALGIMLGK